MENYGGTDHRNHHFPFLNKHGSYFLKLYQHRSYVVALENGPDVDGMYVDEAQTGLSFRNNGNLLLLGGGDHRTGKAGRELEGAAGVRPAALSQCPGTVSLGHSRLYEPGRESLYGNYSASTSGLYVATGFNKWGMTTSYGRGHAPERLGAGKGKPLAGTCFPRPGPCSIPSWW